jgi:hypothetical protein
MSAPTSTPAASVCVLGEGARAKLFGQQAAVGKYVKVNEQWFRIIGVVGQRRAQYQMRQEEENITLEVATAVHQIEQARTALDATRVARDLSRKSLEAEERKYQLGVQTIFFVLQAQAQLAQTEVAVLQAEISYQLARAAVDHATGTLLNHYRVQVQNMKSWFALARRLLPHTSI